MTVYMPSTDTATTSAPPSASVDDLLGLQPTGRPAVPTTAAPAASKPQVSTAAILSLYNNPPSGGMSPARYAKWSEGKLCTR